MEYREFENNIFRYNPDKGVAELVAFATEEIRDFEARYTEEHGKPFFYIGADGYYPVSGAAISEVEWNDAFENWALELLDALEKELENFGG